MTMMTSIQCLLTLNTMSLTPWVVMALGAYIAWACGRLIVMAIEFYDQWAEEQDD